MKVSFGGIAVSSILYLLVVAVGGGGRYVDATDATAAGMENGDVDNNDLNNVKLSSTSTSASSSSNSNDANRRNKVGKEKLDTIRQRIQNRLNEYPSDKRDTRRSYRTSRSLEGHNDTTTNDDDDDGEVDPCQMGYEKRWYYNGFTLFPTSLFQECVESLHIDPGNMMEHLYSLHLLFQQYHCFYDIAKDPENSDPASYQPELGNRIIGVGEGAVDLEAGLRALDEKVLEEGASVATFWEIEELFNQLYDGHVLMVNVEGSYYDYYLWALPERFAGLDVGVTTDFILDENAKLQLTLTYNVSGTIEEYIVETIDGQSVHDFMVYLGKNPAVPIPAQSLGGRVNGLIGAGAIFSGNMKLASAPLNVLPDFFNVTYVGGESDAFVSGVEPLDQWYLFYSEQDLGEGPVYVFDRNFTEAFVNRPGDQSDAFERAVSSIVGVAESEQRRRMKEVKQQNQKSHTKRRAMKEKAPEPSSERNLQRKNELLNGTAMDFHIINEDVAVLKHQAFDDDVGTTLEVCEYILSEATANNVTKLIIDLSSNPGGQVLSAQTLIMCLFPEVDLYWLSDQWDINWNDPMTQYIESIVEIFESIDEQFEAIPDEDFLARVNNFTEVDLEIFEIAAEAIVELCQDADLEGEMTPLQCDQALTLQANVTAFVEDPNLETYVGLFFALFSSVFEYSPWTAIRLGDREPDQLVSNTTLSLWGEGPYTQIRGGVESNTTAKFDLIPVDDLLVLVQSVIRNVTDSLGGNPFDEYIFVSNGGSASSAAIFPYTCAQLYKNRDRTGATRKVSLLGYGGTGGKEDLSLSDIPASVQGVHLENPIMGDAALSMLVDLLPFTLDNLDDIYREVLEYSLSVAIPPYFGDTLPQMPVVNFYDKSMEPGAIPLQFVKIPLDFYIPKIYTSVRIDDGRDLDALYEDVIPYFDRITEPIVETTSEDEGEDGNGEA